jgi:anti-sigma B factor antagonist
MAEIGRQPDMGDLVVSVDSPDEGVVVLRVAGDVDMLTAPVLIDHVRTQLKGTLRLLVVDLTGVTFLGSAGLAALAEAHHTATDASVAVRMVASSRVVLRPLQMTGLDQLLTIVADVDAALAD